VTLLFGCSALFGSVLFRLMDMSSGDGDFRAAQCHLLAHRNQEQELEQQHLAAATVWPALRILINSPLR